ncbi:hypothetical protein [Moorena producens]|uniref:hypothetical protein n=1 Tax=Moorena producens TaxID=1155739 RepID=UPI00143B5BBC|nr:hypothetical protein [Moorena producens]
MSSLPISSFWDKISLILGNNHLGTTIHPRCTASAVIQTINSFDKDGNVIADSLRIVEPNFYVAIPVNLSIGNKELKQQLTV